MRTWLVVCSGPPHLLPSLWQAPALRHLQAKRCYFNTSLFAVFMVNLISSYAYWFSFSTLYLYLLSNLVLSPGGEFCMPSTRLSHSDVARGQPHKSAMSDQTCNKGWALEGCTLHDPWTSPEQNIRVDLPTHDHDCWWKETPGSGAYSLQHQAFCATNQKDLS